jgi:hypothetical protein
MKLMMDIISYVDLTGIEVSHVSFGNAVHDLEEEFSKKPFEIRAGAPITRKLLAITPKLGVSIARVDNEGRVNVFGIPLKVLPESYDENTVLAIMNTQTIEAGNND